MKKNLILILSVLLVCAVMLTACSKEQTPETTAATIAATVPAETAAPAQPLELTDWTMHASTWSSPNGATIHISAVPSYYEEGQKADFVVRLENEEIANIPCVWDGTVYGASADLNAANGYSYYVILTAADGTTTEAAVNTPADPVNEAFINMESALESYCSVYIEDSVFENGQLTLTSGNVQVKAPVITNEGETITCQEAILVLSRDGETVAQEVLALTAAESDGQFAAVLDNLIFKVPKMDDDQKIELNITVTLSNGQILSAFGGNWFYTEEAMLPVVG